MLLESCCDDFWSTRVKMTDGSENCVWRNGSVWYVSWQSLTRTRWWIDRKKKQEVSTWILRRRRRTTMMDEEEREEASRPGCGSEICGAIARALDVSSSTVFSKSAGRLNGCLHDGVSSRLRFDLPRIVIHTNKKNCEFATRWEGNLNPFCCVCGRGGMCWDGLLRDSLSIFGLLRLDTDIFSHGPMTFDGTVGIFLWIHMLTVFQGQTRWIFQLHQTRSLQKRIDVSSCSWRSSRIHDVQNCGHLHTAKGLLAFHVDKTVGMDDMHQLTEAMIIMSRPVFVRATCWRIECEPTVGCGLGSPQNWSHHAGVSDGWNGSPEGSMAGCISLTVVAVVSWNHTRRMLQWKIQWCTIAWIIRGPGRRVLGSSNLTRLGWSGL